MMDEHPAILGGGDVGGLRSAAMRRKKPEKLARLSLVLKS